MARRSRRAATPKEVGHSATSEAPAEIVEKSVDPNAERAMGGMEETKWAGVSMWKCPRCRGTTFNASDAKIHTCKMPRFASDEPPPDA